MVKPLWTPKKRCKISSIKCHRSLVIKLTTVYSDGHIKKTHLSLQISLVQVKRDFSTNTRRKQTISIGLINDEITTTFPIDLPNTIYSISKSGSSRCSLMTIEKTEKDIKIKRLIEIQNQNNLIQFNVSDLHGEYYNDETFGQISWSLDETMICYVAEVNKKENGEFQDDFGEGLTDKGKPILVVVNISTNKVTIFDKIKYAVGQVCVFNS